MLFCWQLFFDQISEILVFNLNFCLLLQQFVEENRFVEEHRFVEDTDIFLLSLVRHCFHLFLGTMRWACIFLGHHAWLTKFWIRSCHRLIRLPNAKKFSARMLQVHDSLIFETTLLGDLLDLLQKAVEIIFKFLVLLKQQIVLQILLSHHLVKLLAPDFGLFHCLFEKG